MMIDGLDLPHTSESTPLTIYCDAGKESGALAYGCGIVFCDHNGRVLEMHQCTLTIDQDTVGAELEAIERAITALRGYQQVQHAIVYSDCEPAVWNAQRNGMANDDHLESCRVEQIPRSENMVADMVASTTVDTGEQPQSLQYGMTD